MDKDTYLIPEDSVEPYYVEKYKYNDREYAKNIIYGGLFKSMKPDLNESHLEKKELHIPKNYIKQSYNVDMK